MTASIKICL